MIGLVVLKITCIGEIFCYSFLFLFVRNLKIDCILMVFERLKSERMDMVYVMQCYSVYAGGNQVRPPASEPSCQVDGKRGMGRNELRVCKVVMRLPTARP